MLLFTLVGCTGAQLRDPNAPLPLGEWCQQVSSRMCDLTAKACANGIPGVAQGCKDKEIPGCLAGRDPATPSGRSGGDLNACLAKLEPMTCEQLSAGTASSELSLCGANLGGSASPPPPPPPSSGTPPTEPTPPRPPVYTPTQPL